MTLICKLVSINCLFYLQHYGPWPYIRLHCSSSFNLSEVAHKLTTPVTCCNCCRVHSWRGWVGTRDGPCKLPYLGMWDISVSSLRGACAELRDMVHLDIRVVHCWVCILLYAFFALPRNSSTVTVPRARWECWAHQTQERGIPCSAIFAVFCSSTTIPNQITPSILHFYRIFIQIIVGLDFLLDCICTFVNNKRVPDGGCP